MLPAKRQTVFTVALALSFLLHAMLFGSLFIKLSHKTPHARYKPNVKIVKAVAISQADVEQEIVKIETQKQLELTHRQEEVARYKSALARAKKKQHQVERKVSQLNRRQKSLDSRIKMAKHLAVREETAAKKEQGELKHLKAQQARLKREIYQHKLSANKLKAAERKRKKLAALKRKQKAAKLKLKAALRKKHHQKMLAKLAEKRRKAVDKAMQDQLKNDEQQLASVHAQELAYEVAKFKTKIVAAIGRSWLVPKGVNQKLACELMIHLGPGGVVLDVTTTKNSGDPVLDRSAKTAVLKASPLPVPSKPELFDRFRELRLTVRPEQVMSRG